MVDLKIGVVGLPDKWSTETLADAVDTKTGFRMVIDMNEVSLDLEHGKLFFREHDLCKMDALIIKKISTSYSPNSLDRLELLRVAEQAGVQVFSPAVNILRLIDRLSCTVTLHGAGIPMPPTRITESLDAARSAVEDFGSAVFKPLYSTKARGMCVIDAEMGIDTIDERILAFQKDNPMMYIQKKLSLPGRDLGMVFLAGKYLGTYARVNAGESWNTTINSGGRYADHQPDSSLIDLAERAQAPFNMDFTTVDVAETEDGPIVFEVSAFGGFRGAKEGMGLDVASLYVDHVIDKLNNR